MKWGKYRALIKRFFVQHTSWLNLLHVCLLNSTSVYDCPNLLPLNKNVLASSEEFYFFVYGHDRRLQIQLVPFSIGAC